LLLGLVEVVNKRSLFKCLVVTAKQCPSGTAGIGCLPVVDGTTLVEMITKTELLRCLKALEAA
jgi:hypothetical protein